MLGVGLNVVAGAMISLPLVGFVASSFLRKFDREWIDLGPIGQFPEGTVRLASYRNPNPRPWDGQTADIPCWVRRIKAEEFQVFAINCTHLGCPIRWFEQSKLFLCPCHGGAFYENGDHAAGPPPRGLYEYPIKVENGSLWVKGGVLPNLSNPGPIPAKAG